MVDHVQVRRNTVVQGDTLVIKRKYPPLVDGAGMVDLVLFGGAPGVAAQVFGVTKAPIRHLVMGVIDHFDIDGQRVMTLYDEVKRKGK